MLFGGASYERIVVVRDDASGLFAVIAIDSTRRGPAFGGIRRMRYGSEAEAVADARRLARAMTRKCAIAGLPAGGGKTVVLVPPQGEGEPRWDAAYLRLGEAIEELGGRYVAGPDVGTGDAELAWVRRATAHVNPVGNDASASTAAGVLAALTAVLAELDTACGPGSCVAVQGLGAVGSRVAAALVRQGVDVVGADPRATARADAQALGVRIVEPEAILAMACDVLVPCAIGQVLDRAAASVLRCRAVCGAANDLLVDEAAALALHRAGIVVAPDFVVNAGAVIEGVLSMRGEGPRIAEAIAAIGPRVAEILAEARREDRPPSAIAIERADR